MTKCTRLTSYIQFSGVAEFQEAAKELRSEIAFYEMHGTAGEAMLVLYQAHSTINNLSHSTLFNPSNFDYSASELVIPFEHRTILAIKDLVASENDIIFKTKDDIIKFAATAYEIRSVSYDSQFTYAIETSC